MKKEKKIKIFIANRHNLFRMGAKNAVKDSAIEVVGEAENLNDLMAGLLNIKADVLLTDHRLYDDEAVDFLPEIKKKLPDLKILILTFCCNKAGLLKYIDLVDGFLCITCSASQLVDAIKILIKGRNYYFID